MSGPGPRQVSPPGVVDGAVERPRHFRLHGLLGRGGHGEVYRATMWREGGVQSEVAVKILSAELAPGSDPVRRLEDEGRLLGALDHPVILKVFDLVVLDGRVALVTEFVDGQDLHDAIHGGGLPLRGLVEAVGLVADALHVAWATLGTDGRPMRLVHRDIKPQNIRLGIHGQVKLLDFGIAQATQRAHQERDDLLGSGPYLPPERLVEEALPLTSKVDVWGLGCVLFEGLAGERLMEGRSIDDMYALGDDPTAFHDFVEQRLAALPVLPRVRGLLAPLLAIDPDDRPTAAELAEACEELTESVPGTGLLRWARTRKWDPRTAEGPLSTLQLVEGTNSQLRGRAPRVHAADPAFSEAVTSVVVGPTAVGDDDAPVEPAPLSAPSPARWDPPIESDDISIQPETDIVMNGASPLGPPVTQRSRVHPAWYLLGVAVALGLAGTGIGAWLLLSTPRALDVFGSDPDEGLVPETPAPEAPEPAPTVAPPRPSGPPARTVRGGATSPKRVTEAPPSDAPASLEATGAPVELRGEFGDFRPGTPLVNGDYEVWVDFGDGYVDTGLRTRAVPDGAVTVSCSREKRRCFVRPNLAVHLR